MKHLIGTALFAAIFLSACGLETEDTVVGSAGDTQIAGVAFWVDTTYVDGSAGRLVARGRARNGGATTISSPWYIEGVFYADKTSSLKLGGSYTQIGVPLTRGQEALWSLTFSSGNVDVRTYPDFRVGDLRAIYK